jgi:hypothetical protein
MGTITWGHDTGVTEDATGNFSAWTGTGTASGSGDAEILTLASGEYMESPTYNIGSGTVRLRSNVYATGSGTPTVQYKQGDSEANCNADTWHDYSVPFTCAGWVKVKVSSASGYLYSDTISGLTINAVDGTAFIDGVSAITSYADGTKTVEIEDSSGNVLTAILDSAGTSEVLGTEINSGTLTANLLYKITATETDHFGTGLTVDDYFTSDGTEACDTSNKVKVVLSPSSNGITLKESI